MSGGTGLLHLFKGIAQYVVVTASGLGLLAGFVTAANAAALGILSSGLHVDSWAGIAAANSAWQNTVNAVSGVGLGLIALLGVIPAAISLLVTALVREAAILVIAATIPIVAAGLVAEATARWFWTALRWLLALVLLTPTVAVVMAVGLQLAAGAAGGTQPAGAAASTDAGQSAVTALVAAAVLLVSVFCPLALFKLFAFVDPATPSGQRLRTTMADSSIRRDSGRVDRVHPAGERHPRAGRVPLDPSPRPGVRGAPGPRLGRPELDVHRRAGAGRRRRRRGHRPRPHPARVAAAGRPPARTARPARLVRPAPMAKRRARRQ